MFTKASGETNSVKSKLLVRTFLKNPIFWLLNRTKLKLCLKKVIKNS